MSTTVIDADTHFWEPLAAFTDYLDPAFRDRAPAFVWDDDRMLIQVGQGTYPSVPNHIGLAMVFGPDEGVPEQIRLDKELSIDPARRLKEMDDEGVAVHVIFPTLGMVGFNYIEDPALAGALSRSYNRYCAEFASADPRRLMPVMLLPFNHPEVAAEEARVAREEFGLTIAFANPTPPNEIPWSSDEYDVLWSAMEDFDITLNFHESTVGAGPTTIGINRYWGRTSDMVYLCTHTVEPQLAIMDMLVGGVCERHPGLRVGLMEAHVSWVPGWLELLDWKISPEHSPRGEKLPLSPSEYFQRQMYVAAFPDDAGLQDFLDRVGRENLVFSSDWPHKAIEPGTATNADTLRERDDVDDEAKRLILESNPKRWLNL